MKCRYSMTAVALAATGGIALSIYSKLEHATVPVAPPPAIASGKFDFLGQRSPPDLRPIANQGVSTSAAIDKGRDESFSATVSRLVATGKPRDTFEAFKILDTCAKAGHPSAATACASLSPGQISMRARLLITAGEGGVPGAYRYASLGHWDYEADQDFQQALPRIVAAAVAAGDADALAGRYAAYSLCEDEKCANRDPAKALAMYTAYRLIATVEGTKLPTQNIVAAELTDELGPGRSAQAVQQGKQLAFDSKGVQ